MFFLLVFEQVKFKWKSSRQLDAVVVILCSIYFYMLASSEGDGSFFFLQTRAPPSDRIWELFNVDRGKKLGEVASLSTFDMNTTECWYSPRMNCPFIKCILVRSRVKLTEQAMIHSSKISSSSSAHVWFCVDFLTAQLHGQIVIAVNLWSKCFYTLHIWCLAQRHSHTQWQNMHYIETHLQRKSSVKIERNWERKWGKHTWGSSLCLCVSLWLLALIHLN